MLYMYCCIKYRSWVVRKKKVWELGETLAAYNTPCLANIPITLCRFRIKSKCLVKLISVEAR